MEKLQLKNINILLVTLISLLTWQCKAQSAHDFKYPHSALQEVTFNEVKIQDDFWLPKIKTVANVTLPLVWKLAEEQGRIENFKIVAGQSDKKYAIRNSPDAPIYKLIEAAGYTLAQTRNDSLEKVIDSLIDLMEVAQDDNGYLHTQFMLPADHPQAPLESKAQAVKVFGFGKDVRWVKKPNSSTYGYSQLFTAGHMFEAAVAYYRATGKRKLLDISIRFADHIAEVFSDVEKVKTFGDHPQFEIGIMKLYEVTQNPKYLELGDKISRYSQFSRPHDLHVELNTLPLHEQNQAYGHCVRTAYVYSGATDVIRATGATDLNNAIQHLWDDVVNHKMYIHGGTGNGSHAEQHGEPYDLPIYPTYSECCANIAQGQWNNRLNLLTADAKFADVVEMEMYNSALSGISLDGTKFFYSNKLNVGDEMRKGKHGGVRETYFFCCPSKLPSFIPGIARWMYAKNNNTLFVNQYVGSTVKTHLGNGEAIEMVVKTAYPYKSDNRFEIAQDSRLAYNLAFRIPSWARNNKPFASELYYFKDKDIPKVTVTINDVPVSDYKNQSGYIVLNKAWKKGDVIKISFTMPVHRVYTSDKDKYNQGRVALMRGPLLYCLEAVDNDFDVTTFVLPASSNIEVKEDATVFPGIPILTGKGLSGSKEVTFKAIPYYMWENRGVAPMSMLLIENPDAVYHEPYNLKTKVNTDG